MNIEIFVVDGFEFAMFFGDHGPGDGVVISPKNAQLHNPDYIEALKRALLVYPIASEFYWLRDGYHFQTYRLNRASDHEIQGWLDSCVQVLDQDIYVFPDEIITQANEMRARLMCEWERRQEKVRKSQREIKSGFVYLLHSSLGFYKIGRTTNPDRRLKDFGVKLPFEVECLCLIQTMDCVGLENQLHHRFAAKRGQGEWFTLEPADIDFIKSLADGAES